MRFLRLNRRPALIAAATLVVSLAAPLTLRGQGIPQLDEAISGLSVPMRVLVIAAHPDFHGGGLGKALTLAGLDHLASKGIGTGMLYVDAENTAAVALYEHIGFTIDHDDRAFVGDVRSDGT